MNKANSYGFKAEYDNIITLGKTLKNLRETKKATYADISRKTLIDISTLYRLEQGEIPRVNFFMLKQIANYYNISILNFFILAGLLTKDEIINFSYTFSELDSKENSKIPLYNSLDDYEKKVINSYFTSPFSYKDSLNAFSSNEHTIIVFDTTFSKPKSKDIFIFKYKNKYILSKFSKKDNYFFLNDIFENKPLIISKEALIIIGKVSYKIENFSL